MAKVGLNMNNRHPFPDDAVEAAFEEYPHAQREKLLQLRDLVYESARSIDEMDGLVETLKWGQPSYLPSKPRVGSTVRLGGFKGDSDRVAVFFHCQTRLVETFREIYGDQFDFEGNRAISIPVSEPLPADPLKHCIAMGLTYHLRSKADR